MADDPLERLIRCLATRLGLEDHSEVVRKAVALLHLAVEVHDEGRTLAIAPRNQPLIDGMQPLHGFPEPRSADSVSSHRSRDDVSEDLPLHHGQHRKKSAEATPSDDRIQTG